jgi:hypothetical protein
MNNNEEIITEKSLYKKKYSIEILEKNIYYLNKKRVLTTQILTADFCVKYLLNNDDISSGSEDSYIFDEAYILHLFSFKTPILYENL